jgi:hypothetical protein
MLQRGPLKSECSDGVRGPQQQTNVVRVAPDNVHGVRAARGGAEGAAHSDKQPCRCHEREARRGCRHQRSDAVDDDTVTATSGVRRPTVSTR